MKAFSDIEQSKKLAEILPHDTADGTWKRVVIAGCNLDVPEEQQYFHDGDTPFTYYSGVGIPSWSLAALLDVLPSSTLDSSDDHHYRLRCKERFTEWHSNQIDACYDMIITLHNKKLL